MMTCPRTACPALALWLAWATAAAAEPVWYPPTEPSPFVPDDARYIGGPGPHLVCFRGTWTLAQAPRRAVMVVAPRQTVRAYVNGQLVAEAWDSHQASPVWVDVTRLVARGRAFIAARVFSEWAPAFYAQMRVEYQDGSWQDFGTDGTWECCPDPPEGWQSDPVMPGNWQPVKDLGGYACEPGALWGREFALLPMELLRQRFEPHNARLREEWEVDPGPPLLLTDPPERPEWAEQFRDFCTLDDSGQLRDGTGRVRHLFFTIYGQDGVLSLDGMDLERLERDLDLMAQADVHLYMRMLGWSWLLTSRGEWAPLQRQPPGAGGLRLELGRDLLDHLVRRAWAHGRYIVFEGDFFWGAHDLVAPPYRSRYHLYPEVLEAQALATRKIMHRYSQCPNVLGMMIGEEDIVLAHDLDNPHQHALFTRYLTDKYGSAREFARQTPWGYDYGDRSGYVPRPWRAEHWPGAPQEQVLVPGFIPRRGVFDQVTDLAHIPLPLWPRLMSPDAPDVALNACVSHNQFTPEDPLWIDFYEMREDWLLFDMLSRWARIVRPGMPRQLLFYSNAQDFTCSWHFLHLYRRADLPFDVIGVGCHDADQDPEELPAWATVRKAIKVISSYRPYALASGSPATGVASGEGQGGRPDHPEQVRDYYAGALFDEIGGGAAWTQTYAWDHVSGAVGGQPSHETPLLRWLGEFMAAVQGVPFNLPRPVQVLIVRNTNLAHSNMSGLDYGNALTVAEALSQLNIEFDIVMDRDIVYGPGTDVTLRVDLAPYRLIILPTVALDFPDATWQALDAWLAHTDSAGPRVLALGWIGKRGPRLQPTDTFHPTLQQWLDCPDYTTTVTLQGKQRLMLQEPGGVHELELDMGRIPPCGVFVGGESILRTPGGQIIGTLREVASNAVVAFGFPLGLAHDPLWGLAPQQDPRDAHTPLYELLARLARVARPVLAPHNLRVYPSSDGTMLLVRERAGLATEAEVAVRLPTELRFPGLQTRRDPDGYTRFTVTLRPWESAWWKAETAGG